jgi:pimeloyl-ACP methyl ester carboxylesterase
VVLDPVETDPARINPADDPFHEADREPDNPLRLRYRVIHGYRRAFRMAGSGPVLLFIHGISDSSRTWLGVLPELAKSFTVLAPDLLGHGGSDKPRADYAAAAYACGMRDLISVLDIDQVTVVGHSLGGGVAMQFAYEFPERCERIVLVGSGGIGREVHPLFRFAAAPAVDWVMPAITSPPAQLATRALTPVLRQLGGFGLGRDFGYGLERYHSLADPTARSAFLRTLRSVVDWRGQVVTMLDRCYLTEGMPSLLIWGSDDRVIPVEHARIAHQAMPGSRLEIFPGAGHFPHQHDPARFIDLIEKFHHSTAPSPYDSQHWRELLRGGRPHSLERPSGT